MIGTEKQVAWASKIKASMQTEMARHVAIVKRNIAAASISDADKATISAQGDTAAAWVMAQESAGWWIDRREKVAGELLAEAGKILGYK